VRPPAALSIHFLTPPWWRSRGTRVLCVLLSHVRRRSLPRPLDLAQGPAFEHGIAARAAEATRTASEATARAGRAANAVSETKRRKRVAPGGKSVMWTSKAEADAEAERAAVEAASFAWSQFPFE
jgi:hypothetical protein